MPRIAYTVPGATSTAHTPIPAADGRGAGPWSVNGGVVGQPGTQGVPTGMPDFDLRINGYRDEGGWGAGYGNGSHTMPGVWYPSLYYQRTLDIPGAYGDPSGGPAAASAVRVWSDNQMPVPARDPTGRAALLARPPVFLRQAQVYQPRQRPRWPTWNRIAEKIGYVGPGDYGG